MAQTRLLGLLGAGLVASAVVAGCGSSGGGPSSSSASATTPLGCPAGLPPSPLQASEAQLECTERALISRVCDLNPDALTQGEPGGTSAARQLRYFSGDPLDFANVTYINIKSVAPTYELSCTIPGGNVATKIGHVELSASDWATIVSPGSDLPAKLQPQNLEQPRPSSAPPPTTPPESYAPVPSVPDDPGFVDCESRAFEVFTRFANGQLTLAQARQQLPAGVPPSSLTSSLEGVKTYESEGISHADAVNEAGGAVGQACPR